MLRPSVALALHRDEIKALAIRHRAGDVRVFGSVARGEDGETSDLDLLVLPAPDASLIDLCAFGDAVEDLVGTRVDVVSERGLSPYLRERILAEARPL